LCGALGAAALQKQGTQWVGGEGVMSFGHNRGSAFKGTGGSC